MDTDTKLVSNFGIQINLEVMNYPRIPWHPNRYQVFGNSYRPDTANLEQAVNKTIPIFLLPFNAFARYCLLVNGHMKMSDKIMQICFISNSIHMKTFLNFDWLRAVQFFRNTVQISLTI
jgi:hypothetical protein